MTWTTSNANKTKWKVNYPAEMTAVGVWTQVLELCDQPRYYSGHGDAPSQVRKSQTYETQQVKIQERF